MKSKQIFLTVAFLFVTFIIKAQDKYEFMIIEFNRILKQEITISIDGKEFLTEKANYQNQDDSRMNANPLLLKVQEYQDEGWEVMNLQVALDNPNSMSRVYFAYLRKKK